MGKLIRWVFVYFYPIFMVVYYLIMRGINLNSVVMLPIFALLGIKAIEMAFKYANHPFVRMASIFLIYSLLTGGFYIFNDAPFNCYTSSLRQFVFPILFAFLGCCYSNDNAFNRWYLIACAACFVVGFYLYTTGPGYYVAFLNEARSNLWYADENRYLNETNILEFTRFSSFFTTSYIVAFFSIPAMALSLGYSLDDNRPIGKPWCYAIAVVSFIAAFLCQQRIAIVFAMLIALFYGLFSSRLANIKKGASLWLVYLVIAVLVFFIGGSIAHFEWFDRIAELVGSRFDAMSFSQAMSERTGQYSSFDRATGLSYIFGLGLGSCGHAAGAAGLKAIHDGEFIKLFYEFGIVGCSLLAFLVVSTLKRGLNNFKQYHSEVIIVVFYLAAGIGADSLTFFVYSAMFWYSMGRIWNINVISRKQNKNYKTA